MRWVYRLDFCTPRYLIRKELGLNKIKMKWGLRAVRFDEKVSKRGEDYLAKKCWLEKSHGGKDLYSQEKEKFFNGLGLRDNWIEDRRREGSCLERMLRIRVMDIQKQLDEARIREARYNSKYKDILLSEEKPQYLKEGNLDKLNYGYKIRALIKVRCGNMKEDNKYWKEKKDRMCWFCRIERDNFSRYIKECVRIRRWFKELSCSNKERLDKLWNDELGDGKGRILEKLWRERERRKSRRGLARIKLILY